MSWETCTVLERRDWTPQLLTLTLQAEPLGFEPGQFVNLRAVEEGAQLKRAYSLASAPGEPPEFFISVVPGGGLSPTLGALRVGDAVQMQRIPSGFFTLAHVPDARDLWLFATGTGLAPYLSMLRAGALWGRFERVVLVQAVRYAADLAYAEELSALVSQHPGQLRLLKAVSREAVPEGILSGRITHSLADGRLEEAAELRLSPEHSHVLMCGNPGMIQEVMEQLVERGMRRHRTRAPGHITIEKYW